MRGPWSQLRQRRPAGRLVADLAGQRGASAASGEGAACPGTRAAEGEAGLASGLVTGAAAAMAAAPAGRSRNDEQSFREVVASARRGAGKGRRWG